MTRFYGLEEIRDAIVVDSEGLRYGHVKDFQVVEDNVYLVVYTATRVNELTIDVDKLVALLRERVSLSGSEPLELLVSIARREGLDIPYRIAEREVEWLKGLIPASEVTLIDVKRIVVDDYDSLVKIVLLNTPREALFRGLKPQQSKPVYRVDQVLGKLVVSKSEGILGIAREVVIAPGSVGVRVYSVRSMRKVINWIAFTSQLKRQGFREAYERLVECRDPYKYSKLDYSLLPEIEGVLKDVRGRDTVLELINRFIEVEKTGVEYRDVPLGRVLRIGDLVIVE